MILFASETGNSESAAKSVYQAAQSQQIPVELSVIDQWDFANLLAKEPFVALFLSSNANGIPSNGAKFFDWLNSPSLTKGYLSHLNIAFFGLGDSSFSTFQWIPTKVYTRLQELGANFFVERGVVWFFITVTC